MCQIVRFMIRSFQAWSFHSIARSWHELVSYCCDETLLRGSYIACENSRPSSLPARVAFREKDVCDFLPKIPHWWRKSVPYLVISADWFDRLLCIIKVVMYQSNRSLNSPPPPRQPLGIWIFGKNFFELATPEAEKLFKCPIISSFQVIKCPHPWETFQ